MCKVQKFQYVFPGRLLTAYSTSHHLIQPIQAKLFNQTYLWAMPIICLLPSQCLLLVLFLIWRAFVPCHYPVMLFSDFIIMLKTPELVRFLWLIIQSPINSSTPVLSQQFYTVLLKVICEKIYLALFMWAINMWMFLSQEYSGI